MGDKTDDGKWTATYDGHGALSIEKPDGTQVCYVRDKAMAERIVAAVNFVGDVPTPMLESTSLAEFMKWSSLRRDKKWSEWDDLIKPMYEKALADWETTIGRMCETVTTKTAPKPAEPPEPINLTDILLSLKRDVVIDAVPGREVVSDKRDVDLKYLLIRFTYSTEPVGADYIDYQSARRSFRIVTAAEVADYVAANTNNALQCDADGRLTICDRPCSDDDYLVVDDHWCPIAFVDDGKEVIKKAIERCLNYKPR